MKTPQEIYVPIKIGRTGLWLNSINGSGENHGQRLEKRTAIVLTEEEYKDIMNAFDSINEIIDKLEFNTDSNEFKIWQIINQLTNK